LCFAFGFHSAGFEDCLDRFLLGGIDKTAGIDDQHVGLAGFAGNLITIGL
jgi:hypothetical protein